LPLVSEVKRVFLSFEEFRHFFGFFGIVFLIASFGPTSWTRRAHLWISPCDWNCTQTKWQKRSCWTLCAWSPTASMACAATGGQPATQRDAPASLHLQEPAYRLPYTPVATVPLPA